MDAAMLHAWRVFVYLVVVLSLGVAAAFGWLRFTAPDAQPQPGWSLGPALPQAFGELASVGLPHEDGRDRLVVLSGITGVGRVADDVFVLDPAAGRWQRGPSLPAPRHHAAAAVLDGAVVIAGGAESLVDSPWQGSTDVWRWTPGDEWESMPGLPEPRWGHRMVEHGGRLYVIGGRGESADPDAPVASFIYRPDHEGWAVASSLPAPRDHLSLVVVEDRIWAIGGRSPGNTARVDIFEPGMETWSEGPALPNATSGAAEAVIDGRIYVYGGEVPTLFGGGIVDQHWVLDTRASRWEWQQAPSPPLAVHGADGAVVDGRFVIAGGASRHGLTSLTAWRDTVQVLDRAPVSTPVHEHATEQLHIPRAAAREELITQGGAEYTSVTHEYPSGRIRVLTWSEGSGPVFRQIDEPSRIFMLEGSVTASVGDDDFLLAAGNAAILPEGTLRNDSPVGSTVILEFLFENDPAADSPAFIDGDAVAWADIAQWYDGEGNPVSVRDPEAIASAPDNAARLSMRNFSLNDVAIRQATLQAGSVTIPGIARSDVLLYIVSGSMRRFEGDHSFVVSAGDSIREAEGDSGHWEVFEDSEVVATDAPR
ncbi:MAG: hypothetical protein JJU27_12545 [Gammaproteobacteria bacterium]|nr:hypothetical protein [Gammaproteobacteria bacterium]